VVTKLDLPSLDAAQLTVSVEAWNTTDRPVKGVVRGAIEAIQFAQAVELGPRERKTLRFTLRVPGLNIKPGFGGRTAWCQASIRWPSR
jgi:hypothetical protein